MFFFYSVFFAALSARSFVFKLSNVSLHYTAQQIFESNGYDDIDVLVGISDEDLLELNITDATHRAALVKVCA